MAGDAWQAKEDGRRLAGHTKRWPAPPVFISLRAPQGHIGQAINSADRTPEASVAHLAGFALIAGAIEQHHDVIQRGRDDIRPARSIGWVVCVRASDAKHEGAHSDCCSGKNHLCVHGYLRLICRLLKHGRERHRKSRFS